MKDGVYYFSAVPADMVPVYGKKRTFWGGKNREFFKNAFSTLTSGTVADIGAGPSYFNDILSHCTVIAVDLFPYKGVQVVADFNTGLPFTDESLDALLLSNVLEHIAEPAVLIAECRRVLKKGGVLVGAVPFMHPVHQAPYDFYRYTEHGLVHQFREYAEVTIEPVGQYYQLYKTTSERFFSKAATTLPVRAAWFVIRTTLWLIAPLLRRIESPEEPMGYHFVCKK